MKTSKLLYLIIFVLFSSFPYFSQENKTIEDFLLKVEKDLNQFDTNSTISYSGINITRRKIKIYGYHNSTKTSFKQKIKQQRKGLNKEITKIYIKLNGKNVQTYEVVKLNGQIYYVYHEEIIQENNKPRKLYEELYYYNEVYQKNTFNPNGTVAYTNSVILLAK